MKNAAIALQRQQQLAAVGDASQAALDQATRESNVARQRLEAAKQKFALIDDPARDEDVAIAQAQVDVARAARNEAEAQLNKTIIRSPIDGVVLRIDRRPGELISTFLDTPILTVGDPSKLNARAEVDEADIGKLRPNMPAYVTAEAFGAQRFAGHVIRIGRMVGKKNVHTDEPRERTDTKILEVLIQLDQPGSLPAGLRVNAFMLSPKVAAHQAPLQHAAEN
ncbi:MAG: HlyD family efflux transporter periplasmic adaptor subunit [Alphaproteobacteria bacterium]|nr:HlyD family efflux transporter periplasmic adaptor subunit [Alphaproteobacteria bacterium]